MVNKARVIVTEDCPKSCDLCCNNFKGASKFSNHTTDGFINMFEGMKAYKTGDQYKEIIITGGEPMLYPYQILRFISNLRRNAKYKDDIYMYTSLLTKPYEVITVLSFLEGITVTIHDKEDWEPFLKLNSILFDEDQIFRHLYKKSFRLNVFDTKHFPIGDFSMWNVKHVEWMQDCPLPSDESLFKLTDFK